MSEDERDAGIRLADRVRDLLLKIHKSAPTSEMIEKAITHVDAANESLATQRIVERLKEAGVIVIPTVGAARHAEKVAELGVDAVIAQGSEGGGHTGRLVVSGRRHQLF